MSAASMSGRTVLVTGGAAGIGAAVVERLLDEGARVGIVDLETPQAAGRGRVHAVRADVADEEAMIRAAGEVAEAFGGLHAAVLAAGIEGAVAPVDIYPAAHFETVLRVNVRGTLCGIRACAPLLIRGGGGSIVLISSISGAVGFPGVSAYTASKHAVLGLMRSAALDLAPHNIRVNAVAPGFTQTRMVDDLALKIDAENPAVVRQAVIARTPLKRYAEPREMAEAILFLASGRGSFCTGTVLTADGGYTL